MFWHIVKKEVSELRRDKKSFWFLVLFPTLLLPLLMGGAIWFAGQTIKGKQSETLEFAVLAPSSWQQQLGQLLSQDEQMNWQQQRLLNAEQIPELINNKQLDFVLQLPAGFDPNTLQSHVWQLHYNQADDVGQFSRVKQQLSPLFEQWQQQYQQQLGLTETQVAGLKQPIELQEIGTAAEREDIGEKVGGMLPYMLIFLCLMGAMIPALDIAAGEKERGTLETLLLAPQQRRTIVLAKFFVVTGASITVALLTVVSGLLWLLGIGQALAAEKLLQAVNAVGLGDLALVLLALVPIAMILAALMLTMSFFARSYKEAQGYLAPVQFVAIVPAIVAIVPGTELTGGILWTPIVNVMVASKELVKGTLDYALLLPIALSNLSLALLLLVLCVYWVSQEKVLFR
ncbi:ABC transporter permease [uncultured Ferrimonas sp.]|uniref:ABC transporter permease n=1 Tax=uncultured Ferrimonas sp. TaxID=432640 RepID=UPI0026028BFC|nr:ABC transporter permease [uncultured Ferrimonas sp.]